MIQQRKMNNIIYVAHTTSKSLECFAWLEENNIEYECWTYAFDVNQPWDIKKDILLSKAHGEDKGSRGYAIHFKNEKDVMHFKLVHG